MVRPQDEQSSFPQCQADQLALLSPVPSQSSILRAQQLKKSAAASQDQRGGGGGGGSDDGMSEIAHRDSPAGTINGGDDEEDEQLKQALALSMQGVSNEHQGSGHGEEEEDVLQKVLQSSMEEDQEQALKRAMEESLRDYDEAHPDDEEMMSASWMSGGSSSSGAGNSSGGTRGGAVNLGIKGVSLEEEDADLNRAIEESIAAAAAASNNNASSTPASVSLNTTSSTAKRPPPTDSTAEMSIQDMRLARMARFSNSANGNADEGTVKRDKGKGKAVA